MSKRKVVALMVGALMLVSGAAMANPQVREAVSSSIVQVVSPEVGTPNPAVGSATTSETTPTVEPSQGPDGDQNDVQEGDEDDQNDVQEGDQNDVKEGDQQGD